MIPGGGPAEAGPLRLGTVHWRRWLKRAAGGTVEPARGWRDAPPDRRGSAARPAPTGGRIGPEARDAAPRASRGARRRSRRGLRLRRPGAVQSSSPRARKSATAASVGGEVGGQAALGDHRHLDHLRPPLRRARAARSLPSPSAGGADRAEADVVGADLGRRSGRRGARRGRRRRRWRRRRAPCGPRGPGGRRRSRCTPSRPRRGDQAEVVGDHQRHVAGVADRRGARRRRGRPRPRRRRRAPAARRRCRRRRAARRAGRAGRRRRPAA